MSKFFLHNKSMWDQWRSTLVQELQATTTDSFKIDYSGVTYRQCKYETKNTQNAVKTLAQFLNVPLSLPGDGNGTVKIVVAINDNTQSLHVYFQTNTHSVRQTYWFDIDHFVASNYVKIYSNMSPSFPEIEGWLREHISNDIVYEQVLILVRTFQQNMYYVWTVYGQSQNIRSIHYIIAQNNTTVVKLKDVCADLVQLTYWLTSHTSQTNLEIHKLSAVFASSYFAESSVVWFTLGLDAKSNRLYVKVSYASLI